MAIDHDSITEEMYDGILDGDPDSIIEGLRAVREAAHHCPAMYRLDHTEDVLNAAIRYLQRPTA